jgi:steroid 5-alpha reductase family enzyme
MWSIVGPLLLTWTLAKWSGAPTIEGKMQRTKPGYADYVKRTSGFVPWFPRRA